MKKRILTVMLVISVVLALSAVGTASAQGNAPANSACPGLQNALSQLSDNPFVPNSAIQAITGLMNSPTFGCGG